MILVRVVATSSAINSALSFHTPNRFVLPTPICFQYRTALILNQSFTFHPPRLSPSHFSTGTFSTRSPWVQGLACIKGVSFRSNKSVEFPRSTSLSSRATSSLFEVRSTIKTPEQLASRALSLSLSLQDRILSHTAISPTLLHLSRLLALRRPRLHALPHYKHSPDSATASLSRFTFASIPGPGCTSAP